jgi:hypothetical protein
VFNAIVKYAITKCNSSCTVVPAFCNPILSDQYSVYSIQYTAVAAPLELQGDFVDMTAQRDNPLKQLETSNSGLWAPESSTVLQRIGKLAYELDLSQDMPKVHPVFHVSLLRPFTPGSTPPPPLSTVIDGEPEWVVKNIKTTMTASFPDNPLGLDEIQITHARTRSSASTLSDGQALANQRSMQELSGSD